MQTSIDGAREIQISFYHLIFRVETYISQSFKTHVISFRQLLHNRIVNIKDIFIIVSQRILNFQWSTQTDLTKTLTIEHLLAYEEIFGLVRFKCIQ